MSLPKNVVRGRDLLDERVPGWRRRIDTDRLNMADGCNCILGEVFGDYMRGLDLLGIPCSEGQVYGFYRRGRQTWASLRAAWLKVLA